jgi:cell division septation protein DedD
VWVQVAGGANEGDLEKAWASLRTKAPDLFRSRQGWTTPLRATNRVLAGPFKSSDEAQEFVNRMAKAGLSGFVFTSTKGQKIERLGGK